MNSDGNCLTLYRFLSEIDLLAVGVFFTEHSNRISSLPVQASCGPTLHKHLCVFEYEHVVLPASREFVGKYKMDWADAIRDENASDLLDRLDNLRCVHSIM